MAARLVVQFQGAEFAFDLRGDAVRVGSAASNSLVLRDPAVGKEHFEVRRMGQGWRLVDLESATGTRVNGLFVNRHDLAAGDVIAVGEARLTFQGDDAVAAAPIPGVPAAAPVAAAPVALPPPVPVAPAPQAYYPQAAPAARPAPAPRHAAPARRPPPRRSDRDYDRGYDRDDDRDRRRRGGSRGGAAGAAGGLMAILLIGVIIVVGIGLFYKYGITPPKKDPNPAVLEEIKELSRQGKFEEAMAKESEGDPNFRDTFKEIVWHAGAAKKHLEEGRVVRQQEEGEAFYAQKIKAYRESSPDDTGGLALRCDEFLQKYPDHARYEEVEFYRLRATGEPSPAWLERRKGGTAAGAVSWADLTRAAESESARFVEAGNWAGAWAVYERFERAAARTVLPEFLPKFKEEVARVKAGIENRARKAFEKFEEETMIIEDRGNIAEAEDLYRKARDTYPFPDIKSRCDAELERLRGVRRK